MISLQTLGGKLGKAIDIYGKTATALTSWIPWQKPINEYNISESLQSWGGAPTGSPFVWVRPTQAAEPNVIIGPSDTWTPYNPNNPPSNQKPTGQVLGISRIGGTSGTSGTGGTGEGGGPSLDDILNSIYSPIMSQLSEYENLVRSQYERAVPEVEAQYRTSRESLEAERGRGERELALSEQQALQSKEDAMAAARRLYNELIRGGRQRFGALSSAGQGFTEIMGQEFQRQQMMVFHIHRNNIRVSRRINLKLFIG